MDLIGRQSVLERDIANPLPFATLVAQGVAYGSSAPTKRERERRRITNDDLSDLAFGEFLRKACVNFLSVTKGAVYISMSSSELHTLQTAFSRPIDPMVVGDLATLTRPRVETGLLAPLRLEFNAIGRIGHHENRRLLFRQQARRILAGSGVAAQQPMLSPFVRSQ
jgi:hypothetical protein